MPIPEVPFTIISWDFITGLLKDKHGNDSVIVLRDYTCKVTGLGAAREEMDAPQLAKLSEKTYFSRFGVPTAIVSDRGSLFTSKFWTEFANTLGIQRKLTTAHRPQADGHTERLNQDVEKFLRAFVSYDQSDWSDWLRMAEFAINSAVHTSLHMSPFEALYGFQPQWKTDNYEDCMNPQARKMI